MRFLIEALQALWGQHRDESFRTEHYYGLVASVIPIPPARELVSVLDGHGYEIEADERPNHLILRDRRVRRHYGAVTITLPVTIPGRLTLVALETADDGPEFYDELAHYVIAALDDVVKDLIVRRPGQPEAPARELTATLPPTPLGLVGIDSLR